MNHQIKYFKTKVANRTSYVEVHSYPGDAFIIKFINDKYSDFINSFKSFGFGVTLNQTGELKFELSGAVTPEIAKEVWEDISHRLDQPDHTLTITGFQSEDQFAN